MAGGRVRRVASSIVLPRKTSFGRVTGTFQHLSWEACWQLLFAHRQPHFMLCSGVWPSGGTVVDAVFCPPGRTHVGGRAGCDSGSSKRGGRATEEPRNSRGPSAGQMRKLQQALAQGVVQSWKLKAVARKALDDAQADHKSTDKFHNSHKPAESLLSSECVTYRSSLQFKMESASEAIKHLLWS